MLLTNNSDVEIFTTQRVDSFAGYMYLDVSVQL